MADDVEDRVKALVAHETGMSLDQLLLRTRIVQDIGCDGDDAVELFECFAKEFEVDLSGIQWRRHFCDEGLGCPVGCLFALLFGWSGSYAFPYLRSEPVTIGDLVEAAKAKQWVKKYRSDRIEPK